MMIARATAPAQPLKWWSGRTMMAVGEGPDDDGGHDHHDVGQDA